MHRDAEKPPEGASRAVKVIKRYANRKLYDTDESCYVTLEEIADAIRAGDEVQIIDNRTSEDLTAVTLAQIIFEQEKKRSLMPLALLRDLIRNGGAQLTGYFQSGVGQVTNTAEVIRGKIRRRDDQPSVDPAEMPLGKAPAAKKKHQPKELLTQSQKALDDWQQKLDVRVHQAVENLTALPTLANEIGMLEQRLRELESRLEEIDPD